MFKERKNSTHQFGQNQPAADRYEEADTQYEVVWSFHSAGNADPQADEGLSATPRTSQMLIAMLKCGPLKVRSDLSVALSSSSNTEAQHD